MRSRDDTKLNWIVFKNPRLKARLFNTTRQIAEVHTDEKYGLLGHNSMLIQIRFRGSRVLCFSFNGVGDPFSRVDVRAKGMGGAGRALADGLNFSSANPALLSSFARAGLSSLYMVQRRTLKDNLGASHVVSDGDIGPIQLVLPVGRAVVVGIGLEPLTDMDFSLVDTLTTGQFPHILTIDGTGGMQALSIAAGKRFGRFAAGARLDLAILGTINETWKKDYADASTVVSDGSSIPELLDTQDQFVRTHRGVQPSVGGLYTPLDKLTVGLTLKAGSTIKQTQIFRNIYATMGF